MGKIIYDKYGHEPSSNNMDWYVNEFNISTYNENGEPTDGGYVPLTDISYSSKEEAMEAANKMNEELGRLSKIEIILPNTDDIKFNPLGLV